MGSWNGYWKPWGWLSELHISPFTWLPETPSKEEEIAILKEEAILLELELDRTRRRIEKLKKQEMKNA